MKPSAEGNGTGLQALNSQARSRPPSAFGTGTRPQKKREGKNPGASGREPRENAAQGKCEPLGCLPAGITVEGATPPRGGVSGGPKGGPLTPPRWRTSAEKGGGRSLHFLPLPCGATTRRAGRGRAMPAPHAALPRRIRGIRANPRPMRVSGHSLDHNGEGFAL